MLFILIVLPIPGVGFKPFSTIKVVESGQGYALLWFPSWTYAVGALKPKHNQCSVPLHAGRRLMNWVVETS